MIVFTILFNKITCTGETAATFTSLWSIKRERWINGPNLQDSGLKDFENIPDYVCFIGVGKEEAYIMAGLDEFVGYNINNNNWTVAKSPPNAHVIRDFKVDYRSCVFHQDKHYNR